jgi:hypothetical protein
MARCHCAHRKRPEKTDLNWSVNFYPSRVKELNGKTTRKVNRRRGIQRTKRYFGADISHRYCLKSSEPSGASVEIFLSIAAVEGAT